MKVSTLIAPILLSSLLFAAVWAMGMMALRSSTLATEASLEMLRLQIEVSRLQATLASRSQERVAAGLDDLESRSTRPDPSRASRPLHQNDSSEPISEF